MSEEKLKIVFAPGCFDNFDGTQEELDQLLADIQRMVDSGEIFEKAVPLDVDELLDSLDEDEIEDLMNQLDEHGGTTRTLQ